MTEETKRVIAARTRAAVYAKAAGDLDAVLEMSSMGPGEWLRLGVADLRDRYRAEMAAAQETAGTAKSALPPAVVDVHLPDFAEEEHADVR